MGNTEGGRLHRSIHRQIYFDKRPAIIETCCPPRTTLSMETTPAESSRYVAHACDEIVDGQPTGRKTYQAGVSQEQIQAFFAAARIKNYGSESIRLTAKSAACPGYSPPFTNTIPPVLVCPPLPPPPAPPMIPGVNPRQCVNRIY